MVLSETIQFASVVMVTIVFSAFSFTDSQYRLVIKLIAGLMWFILSLTTVAFFGGTAVLTVPLMFMFMGIGLFFFFTTISDWKQKKRDEIWNRFGDD